MCRTAGFVSHSFSHTGCQYFKVLVGTNTTDRQTGSTTGRQARQAGRQAGTHEEHGHSVG